jgi:metal-sulfur cluster biosynthetic enzyme
VTVQSAIVESLRSVHDPCCRDRDISVVDMGLVRSIAVDDGRARVELVLTTGWCPFAANVVQSVEDAVGRVAGVDTADVEIVWDEPWTMDRMSHTARAKLVFLPDPAAVPDRDRYIASFARPDPVTIRTKPEDRTGTGPEGGRPHDR